MKKLSITVIALAVFAVLGFGNVAFAKAKQSTKHPCSSGSQLISGGKIKVKGGGGGPVCG